MATSTLILAIVVGIVVFILATVLVVFFNSLVIEYVPSIIIAIGMVIFLFFVVIAFADTFYNTDIWGTILSYF